MSEGSKRTLLALLSVLIIAAFFSVPFHKEWFDGKVIAPLKIVEDQLVYMDREDRMAAKLTTSYLISKSVGDNLRAKNQDKTAIVLLPPQGFIKEQQADFPVPEPAVFYYYSGIRSKWINSPGVDSVTHAVIYQAGNMQLLPLNDTVRKEVINVYKRYSIK